MFPSFNLRIEILIIDSHLGGFAFFREVCFNLRIEILIIDSDGTDNLQLDFELFQSQN